VRRMTRTIPAIRSLDGREIGEDACDNTHAGLDQHAQGAGEWRRHRSPSAVPRRPWDLAGIEVDASVRRLCCCSRRSREKQNRRAPSHGEAAGEPSNPDHHGS